MTFRFFLILMSMATIVAWGAWLVVLMSIDPSRTGLLGFVFFYAALALALVGTLTIVGTGVRVWAKREETVPRQVARAFRQSLLLSVVVVGSLLLLPAGFFAWWSILLLIVFVSLIELGFLSASRPKT